MAYKSGCMGLRSVPSTLASGYSWAGQRENGILLWKLIDVQNSMAQLPVPVARSRTRLGFVIGARCDLPSSITRKD